MTCKFCGYSECRCRDIEMAWNVARAGQKKPYQHDNPDAGRRVPRHRTLDEIEGNTDNR